MSLYRTVARMAAVCALNNYLEEPWPTLAGPHIFDSKIEPVEDVKHDIMFPCVVVYTDYDKDQWTKAGKAHEPRLMSLTLELLVVQTEQQKDGKYRLECPQVDSEIETTLDALETQVFRALSTPSIAADAFNYICPTYVNTTSRRGATVEGGLRLAARQITLEMNAVRENPKGIIPAEIDAFLTRVEAFLDYKDRISYIRELLTAPAGQTHGDFAASALAYGTGLAALLGAPVGNQPILTTPITYHYSGVSP